MNREYRTDKIAGKALRWVKYRQRSEQKQASSGQYPPSGDRAGDPDGGYCQLLIGERPGDG